MHITARTSWIAFVLLVALAALSWGVSFLPVGGFAIPIALLVASAKVAVVALVFMELGEHGGGIRLVALTAPAFVALLLLLMLADVWLR